MKNLIFRVRFWLHAQCSILRYRRVLRRKTDDELSTIIERERSCRGWTSQRSYFLTALRQECHRRDVAYCW